MQRRAILAASMLAVDGRIQREGDVVHLVARTLTDLSSLLASVGNRDLAAPPPYGRGDDTDRSNFGVDPATRKGMSAIPVDAIKVKARDFR
jgi:error-prone DNA polymerase